MTPETFHIREIKKEDNPKIAMAIRSVLIEFGVPKVGTAYEDKTLDTMYEEYLGQNSIYYIIEMNGSILGGAGIKQLANYEGNTCELQKMYFKAEARGKGLGTKMMSMCLNKAKEFGFDHCYLETLPYMKDARKLYRKVGFEDLNKPLGNTGHYSCNLWMIKKL